VTPRSARLCTTGFWPLPPSTLALRGYGALPFVAIKCPSGIAQHIVGKGPNRLSSRLRNVSSLARLLA
jgi:hypothetical protein